MLRRLDRCGTHEGNPHSKAARSPPRHADKGSDLREVRLLGALDEAGPPTLPAECPLTLDEWLGEDFDTEGVALRLRG
jgi:hypothetical protein